MSAATQPRNKHQRLVRPLLIIGAQPWKSRGLGFSYDPTHAYLYRGWISYFDIKQQYDFAVSTEAPVSLWLASLHAAMNADTGVSIYARKSHGTFRMA
jgi:hypothetical protein